MGYVSVPRALLLGLAGLARVAHSSIVRTRTRTRTHTLQETPEASNLTKDYTGSALHRYKVAGSKNFQHITHPSAVLHISNLPQGTTEEQLRQIFGDYGAVIGFKFFPYVVESRDEEEEG